MPDRSEPAFEALGESLRELAARGTVRRWRKGTVLIEEGEMGDEIYLILNGRLRVYSRDERGREITFGSYTAGEYVGEMSLDGGPRSASVVAETPCACVTITRATLREHIARSPEFAFELLAKVVGRARAATLSARQLALNDVYGRLRLLLLGTDSPHVATHQQIASRIGSSREMVSRLMKDLVDGGFVAKVDDGGWTVCKPLPPRW